MARKNQSRASRRDTAVAAFREAMEKAQEAIDLLEAAKDDFTADLEGLKEELESWKDNMPENLQGSEKYATLESSVEELDSAIESLNEIDLSDVMSNCEDAVSAAENAEFPGMRQ